MWSPTHVQVTVQRARNLRIKGRGATNDAFVLIQMGKDKFQTSVKEKCIDPEWYEECDLTFQQLESHVVLVVYHRNLLGLDEFLGEISVPIKQFEHRDGRNNRWYNLKGRGAKEDGKQRGEIEVSISLVVRSCDTQSLNDFSLGKKRKSLKGIATSVGHKLQKIPGRSFSLRAQTFDPRARLSKLRERRNSSHDETDHTGPDHAAYHQEDEESSEFEDIGPTSKTVPIKPSRKYHSLYSSTLSLPQSAMITTSIQEDKSLENEAETENEKVGVEETSDSSDTSDGALREVRRRLNSADTLNIKLPLQGEWTHRISRMKDLTRSEINLSDMSRNDISTTKEKKTALESIRNTLRRHTLNLAEPPDLSSLKRLGPARKNADLKKNTFNKISEDFCSNVPMQVWRQYEKMDQQDLVMLAIKQQTEIERMRDKMSDMENYLDNLLVRVMETTPRILQTPYESLNPAFSR